MIRPLRVGVVGLGKAGLRHIAAVDALDEVVLAGVCDSAPSAREAFDAVESLEALFARDVDAVIVAVPHHALLDVALRSIEAGKHVLLEKPMANTLEDAERIVDAARRSGVRLMVNYNHRFRDEAVNARRLLDEGAIGDVTFVSAHMFAAKGPLPDWVWEPGAAGGGMMTYSGSHMIDRCLTILDDEVTGIAASTCSVSYGEPLEDTAVALLRCADGRLMSLSLHKSNVAHGQASWETRVFGSGGAMRIVSGDGVYVSSQGSEETIASGPDRRFEQALAELAAAIRDGRDPTPGGDDGLRVRACLDRLYRDAGNEPREKNK